MIIVKTGLIEGSAQQLTDVKRRTEGVELISRELGVGYDTEHSGGSKRSPTMNNQSVLGVASEEDDALVELLH